MSSSMTNNYNESNLWRQASIVSANSYSSSSGRDNSFDYSEKEYSLDFITPKSDNYYQLIDDLAIIDEIYQTYNDEVESEPYERQVADAARNVAHKLNTVSQICQTEEEYIMDLEFFLFYYMEPMERWIQETNNADIFQKYPTFCFKNALIDLFEISKELTRAHKSFHKSIQERFKMWGPTQFISDLFTNFYEKSIIYEKYLNNFPDVIVTIDTLYRRSSGFPKFIEHCVSRANIPNTKDFLFYLKNPILRLSAYTSFVSQLSTATELSHPDYRALMGVKEKFEQRNFQWEDVIKDRLSHIRALEAFQTIQDNPAAVTATRRLIINGPLTKIDISNPHCLNDIRTYFLYNDLFFFCQKMKQNNNNNHNHNNRSTNSKKKLIYKGTINLRNAEIMPLSAKYIAKMTEVKKSSLSSFSSFMSRNKSPIIDPRQQSPSSSFSSSEDQASIFGFEMHISNDIASEVMFTSLRGEGLSFASGNGTGDGNKRLFIMRTQTEAEQNAWITFLRQISKHISQKK
ncbi:Dbl homology domain-containing protein [Cokeromyces recurvatus]|uniref:Dbl homology domain-containing protein n=1 Tax=Cokeromyces recurvatus TaxID=90255 RepID=UPI00221FAA74|nr:Dbl homology domain-containing protein [Cokeromyces recurvatus]KAI7903960.1 Dbl homology domain-containing protein [Cokeromyces recurvatus]